MLIRFTRLTNERHRLEFVRDDGTSEARELETRSALLHDLVHYAVETTLGLRQSFFALVASGVDITAFAVPKEKRTFQIPVEAVQTEHIVGHLQVEMADGALIEDFNGSLAAACLVLGQAAPPPIPAETLDRLRAQVRDLWRRWQEIPPGGTLELEFPAAGG